MTHQTVGDADNPRRMNLSNDPARGDKPRNVNRAIVRVKVADDRTERERVDGMGNPVDAGFKIAVAGYSMKPGETHTITVYTDQLDELYRETRTDEHKQVVEHAKRAAEQEADAWIRARTGDIADDKSRPQSQRDAAVEIAQLECPIYWSQYLEQAAKFLGLDARKHRTGVPPLESVEVLREIEPPDTPDNIAQKTGDAHATAIAQAFAGLLDHLGVLPRGPDATNDDDEPTQQRRRGRPPKS